MPFEIAESQKDNLMASHGSGQQSKDSQNSMLFQDNRVLFDGISQLAVSNYQGPISDLQGLSQKESQSIVGMITQL